MRTVASKQLSVHQWLFSVALLVTIVFFSFRSFFLVPEPQTHTQTHLNEFSESRARAFLRRLETLGPRLLGTPTNEVGAPLVILSEVLSSFVESVFRVNHVSGLSFPFSAYSAGLAKKESGITSGDGSPEDPPGCLCPIQASLSDLTARINNAAALCAPDILFSSPLPAWVIRLRDLVQISSTTGCQTPLEWARSELIVRTLKDAYGVTFPAPAHARDNAYQRVIESLLADTIAASRLVHMTATRGDRGVCQSAQARAGCAAGASYPVDRFLLSWESTPEATAVLDISWSHHFTGNYSVYTPSGGTLLVQYQNLTNVAVRLAPLPLFLKRDTAERELMALHRQRKELQQTAASASSDAMREKSHKAAVQRLTSLVLSHAPPLSSDTPTEERRRSHGLPAAFALASHFDTAVESPGGADAGTGVAVILEVFKNILGHAAQRKTFFPRPFVMILNGGEENILPAAHGFITFHPWTSTITDLVNLEAAGSVSTTNNAFSIRPCSNMGKETILRTGKHSNDHIRTYQAVVSSPLGMSVNQDSFESGIVPGLTDFEFYRDLGHMEGIDLAFGTGGYYYHSALDSMDTIPPGSIQHYGNTVRGLTFRTLETAPEMSPEEYKERRRRRHDIPDVFFDVMGTIMLVIPAALLYSPWTLLVLAGVLLLVAKGSAESHLSLTISSSRSSSAETFKIHVHQRFNTDKEAAAKREASKQHQHSASQTVALPQAIHVKTLLVRLVMYFVAFGSAVVINGVFARLLDAFGLGMRWFGDPVRVPVLYGILPAIVLFELGQFLTIWQTEPERLQRETVVTMCTIWIIFYAVPGYFQSSFSMGPFVLLVTVLTGRFLGIFIRNVLGFSNTSMWTVTGFTLLGQAVGFVIVGQQYSALMDHLAPICGRVMIPETAEVVLSFITTAAVFLFCPLLILIPSQCLTTSPEASRFARRTLYFFFLPLALSFVLSHPPFTKEIPQRLDVVHFTTRAYDTTGAMVRMESGVTVQGADNLGIRPVVLHQIERALAPFWIPPLTPTTVITQTSFFEDNVAPPDATTILPNKLTYFNVPSDARHGFWRFPQGALFRCFANPWLHVYPHLIPPFRPDSYHQHVAFNASWQVLDDFFVKPVTPPSYSARHSPLSLQWTTTPRENTTRRISLSVQGPSKMIIMVPAQQAVRGWSLSDTLPSPRPECACYATLFGAGVASPMGYTFWIDVDAAASPTFTIAVTGNYLDIKTPPLQRLLQLEKDLNAADQYVTMTATVGETGFWKIPV